MEITASTLSPAEFQAALEELAPSELGRLERAARMLSSGTGFGPDDLLQEAVCRTLEANRNCPRNVPVVVFLYNAMKSLASSERKYQAGIPRHDSLDDSEGGAMLQVAAPGRTAEEALVARVGYEEGVRALQTLFDDDPDALLVVMGDLDGMEAGEVRAIGGMDATTFASVRRRVRRRIDKEFPGGWKP